MDKHKLTNKHKEKVASMSSTISSCVDETSRVLSSENGNFDKFPNLSPPDFMSMISQLLVQNNELKNFIIEQASEHKKETSEIVNKVIEQTNKVLDTVKTNQTTINNNNQKFNINVFLTEQCKGAINFSDFIKSIEVTREDLENNAQLGFVGGVSKILIESLKQLSKTERPIHCTDIKRETMYIKNEDKWNKEEDYSKLNQAIQEVTRKSMRTLLNWKEENPDAEDADSAFSNHCITIQQNSMAAYDRETYYPKVIKAVAKEVALDN
jgi:hypothetical protein